MNLNGCHNRNPLKLTHIVQDGWYGTGIKVPRTMKMKEINDPLTRECQYQKLKKDDPKCECCRELIGKL